MAGQIHFIGLLKLGAIAKLYSPVQCLDKSTEYCLAQSDENSINLINLSCMEEFLAS